MKIEKISGVFLYWQTENDKTKLVQNFTFMRNNVRRGRWWTWWTSTYSHKDVIHIFMVIFPFF